MLEGKEGNQRWLLCVVETKPLAQPFASLSLSFPFCKMERIISLPKILPESNWTVNNEDLGMVDAKASDSDQ